MDKKDIYEHLAKIYLDASSKKKKKRKKYFNFKNIFFVGILFLTGTSLFFFSALRKNKSLTSEFALILCPEPVKLNFNFDPAKKELYTVDLNRLDLIRFKALGFSVKKTDYNDTISLRVEFVSAFKEKSEVYLKNIPHKWQDYKINLSDFKNITDWSEMLSLSFIVEEWNAKQKKDVVYIDNVRFIR